MADDRTILALGVGCERNAAAGELEDLVRRVLTANGLSTRAIACVASLDTKADETAIHALAAALGAPTRFFDADTLAREEPRVSEPSEAVRRAVGIASVAEAAALACVGPGGHLLVPKQRSARATCAIAAAPRAS